MRVSALPEISCQSEPVRAGACFPTVLLLLFLGFFFRATALIQALHLFSIVLENGRVQEHEE